MKTIATIICCILTYSSIFSQIDCKPYLPISKGSKWEITNYSAKEKEMGKITYELIDKVEANGKLTFTIKSIQYDKKGNETFSNTFEAYCENGIFEFDMAFRLNGESMKAYQNMDVDLDATAFEIPSMDVNEGTTLKDGSLVVNVGSNGIGMMRMTILVTDRKVAIKEKVTTSAGTFDCIKLSQKVSTKLVVNIEGTSHEWYAENVGMVRSESYNKKGKLMGYSELTKLERK